MSFSEIKGQARAIKTLKRVLAEGRLAHAYIFLGPQGGRQELALNLAKAVNCLQNREGEPCEKCPSCRKISGLNHPDVQLIEPEGLSLKIGQMRRLQDQISLKPFEGKKKVHIIEEAEKMTPEAANSLLKTLEEPPGESLLILGTSNLFALFPTIISRCQLLKLNFPVLEKREPGKGEEIQEILRKGLSPNREELFTLSREFSRQRESMEEVLDLILAWHRDILILKESGEARLLFFPERKKELEEEGSRFSSPDLEKSIEQVLEAKKFMGRNANLRLIFEVMFLKLARIRAPKGAGADHGRSSRSEI
jgi:DNA polymerase-3 subunit delta'